MRPGSTWLRLGLLFFFLPPSVPLSTLFLLLLLLFTRQEGGGYSVSISEGLSGENQLGGLQPDKGRSRSRGTFRAQSPEGCLPAEACPRNLHCMGRHGHVSPTTPLRCLPAHPGALSASSVPFCAGAGLSRSVGGSRAGRQEPCGVGSHWCSGGWVFPTWQVGVSAGVLLNSGL